MSDSKTVPSHLKFLLGGISGMGATCVVQPMDLIKNRLQISGTKGNNTLNVLCKVLKNEGFLSLYSGLSAGLFRQVTYTSSRLGMFNTLKDTIEPYNGKSHSLLQLMSIGAVAGAFGAIVGTPSEVALVRMTNDKVLPVEKRRNYKNVFQALYQMSRQEGLRSLWTGCGPTVGRAIAVNVTQLSSYSKMKSVLLENGVMKDGFGLYLTSSVFSGFVTALCSTPMDTIKTRIQNSRGEYKNAIDCIAKTAKNEGISAFMKGFTPFFLRIAPHTVITFLLMEKLTNLYITRFV